jgi:hypothetical protein
MSLFALSLIPGSLFLPFSEDQADVVPPEGEGVSDGDINLPLNGLVGGIV